MRPTDASPANSTVLQEFLDCLTYHNATDYAYYVTPDGYLTLSSLSGVNSDNEIDKTPYRICNHLFGLGFYASFDLGFRKYYDGGLLSDVNDVSGEMLVNEGVISRESAYTTNSNMMNLAGLQGYVDTALSMGYNKTEIASAANINISAVSSLLTKRDTLYQCYAADEDYICYSCDHGYFR